MRPVPHHRHLIGQPESGCVAVSLLPCSTCACSSEIFLVMGIGHPQQRAVSRMEPGSRTSTAASCGHNSSTACLMLTQQVLGICHAPAYTATTGCVLQSFCARFDSTASMHMGQTNTTTLLPAVSQFLQPDCGTLPLVRPTGSGGTTGHTTQEPSWYVNSSQLLTSMHVLEFWQQVRHKVAVAAS